MAKYQQLIKSIIEDIRDHSLVANTKLPSLRQLAKQHEVSISTAVNCYQELESQGWIIAKPKQGFFVRSIDMGVAQPEFKQFDSYPTSPRRNKTPYRASNGVLGVSCMPIDSETIAELDRCFIRTLKRYSLKINRYPDPIGEERLRKAISRHFCAKGFPIDHSHLVITQGAMSAINTALEIIAKPGDTIAISSPCFSGYMDLLVNLQLKVIEIPSNQNGIDLKQLEHHLQQGNIQVGLFSTTFMNPQGITLSVEQKQKLAKLSAQYKTPIIEDDVYVELSHDKTMPLPAKYYDKDGYIIWCGSLSKSLSASYRLGWCLSGRYFSEFSNYYSASSRGVSQQIQNAITEYFSTGLYDKYIKRQCSNLSNNMYQYRHYLNHHLPNIIKISNPNGGMTLWIEIKNHNAEVFSQLVNDHQLDIREGALFSSLPIYDNYIRINIGYPIDQAQEQLDLLIKLIKVSQRA
ncbi:PLP-dependent aminotransferase family protein [Photobacterium sp. GB-210]|uniref:aminotransferase-like domain-containing protein n=1 Tax=Photobacterium sp. GB-210 TaxID=2022104 RepID=UPI000D15D212|nr:PLP-dependent aminotransferase family protein [Photobacterium sp. GB-210]PSV32747.1 transcriptional regulator [Photobacterium sp. GB-210]